MKELPNTVQVYLKKGNSYLLMYRNKKKNDMNEGKWIGVGGHVEKGESIDQAVIREVKEETGLGHQMGIFGCSTAEMKMSLDC